MLVLTSLSNFSRRQYTPHFTQSKQGTRDLRRASAFHLLSGSLEFRCLERPRRVGHKYNKGRPLQYTPPPHPPSSRIFHHLGCQLLIKLSYPARPPSVLQALGVSTELSIQKTCTYLSIETARHSLSSPQSSTCQLRLTPTHNKGTSPLRRTPEVSQFHGRKLPSTLP